MGVMETLDLCKESVNANVYDDHMLYVNSLIDPKEVFLLHTLTDGNPRCWDTTFLGDEKIVYVETYTDQNEMIRTSVSIMNISDITDTYIECYDDIVYLNLVPKGRTMALKFKKDRIDDMKPCIEHVMKCIRKCK